MSASFEAILLSRSYTFIVGADAVPITVHEAALAELAPGLKALMRTEMSEGLAREARWDDVDKETFIRFAQFAYIGDYSTPTMIVKPSVPAADQTPRPPSPDDDFFLPANQADKNRAYPRAAPVTKTIPVFKDLIYPRPMPQFNFEGTYNLKVGDGMGKNIGEILHIHASLYVLAQKWGVDRLKRLTLFKIHKTLNLFSLDALRLEVVVGFVRYIYSDERTPDLASKVDELRELVRQYIVANAEFTSRNTTFLALIEEGGALARDLWKYVAPRVNK
ncbi:hypothetical protein IFR04_013571 [Cadophora malorum]|uniref:BTB domain-containing protein n=1 Tax=Cadophora malorum TaxID=108018 RepID=A0A8H7T2A2_9HELO|nr:hypothetical protein IFR04_013571 [Cadophora malorum]